MRTDTRGGNPDNGGVKFEFSSIKNFLDTGFCFRYKLTRDKYSLSDGHLCSRKTASLIGGGIDLRLH